MASNGDKETNSPTQGNNLDSLVADLNLKFIFVGGKGGVGKTTSSAAIATQLSFNRKGQYLSFSNFTQFQQNRHSN